MTDRLDIPLDVPERQPDDADELVGADDSDGVLDPEPREPGAPEAVRERSLAERAYRRVTRRPREWVDRPWTTDRAVRFVVTFLSLGVTGLIMISIVHLNPVASKDLIFDDTTPTGGDFGAHVWGPAYLRDHLLPNWRLNGWSMDWYAGMPAYRFYMVLPALAIVAVNSIGLPYGVAMKLVSILGLLTLPACCWAFGRLARFRYPLPELFAFAGLAFVLDESFTIYGGNVKSTMAGEFSHSIALSLAVLALGVLAAGLQTGRYRVWASVLIAAACVSHGIVMIFVVLAAVIFSLVWIDRTRVTYALTVGVTSVLLLAFWVGPFLLNHAFMTDMKYGGEPGEGSFDSWWDMFFPLTAPLDVLVMTLAVIGFGSCIVRRHLNGAALGVVGIALWFGVYATRDSLPVIGLLWNPRLLPFLYLVRYLLMMVGAVEILSLFWNLIRNRPAQEEAGTYASTTFAAATALVVLVIVGFMYQWLPFDGIVVKKEGEAAVYAWGPFTATPTNSRAVGDGWSRYNFMGYEGRGEYYTEYHQVVSTMAGLGDDPAHGCGRALWENHEDNGKYGTTMALMLLPFWTDGCIGSMEGLFFEASGTTPYHFLTAAAMSKNSSNPVRELRYTNNDAEVGVPHLQDLGVRYVMLRSSEAQASAAQRPELTMIAESYPWKIYQVAGSDVVVPLDVQPVVVNGRSGDQRERNLELGTSWFQHRDEWAAMPADDGPDTWQRIDVRVDETRRENDADGDKNRVDVVVPEQPIEPVALEPVSVSNVVIGDQDLSFDVDRVGVPVLVKVSYFPNWEVEGADGPYRIGPNMMVVVPTENSVRLEFGRSMSDYASVLMTLVGIGLCFYWRRQGDVVHAGDMPAGFGPLGGSDGDPGFEDGFDPGFEDGFEDGFAHGVDDGDDDLGLDGADPGKRWARVESWDDPGTGASDHHDSTPAGPSTGDAR
jgi:hypothetical protein